MQQAKGVQQVQSTTPSKWQTVLQAAVAAGVQHGYMGGDIPEWEGPHLPCRRALLTLHASCTLVFETHSSFEEKNVRSNIRIFVRRLYLEYFTAPLPTGCSNANQRGWRQVEASATKSGH